MSMSLLQTARDALVNVGIYAYMVNAPDETPAVVIVPYNPDTDPDLPMGRQSFHVRVRTDAYVDGEDLAWKAFKAIREADWSVADRKVHSVIPRQEPFFLGLDDTDKYVHEFNFDVIANWKE